MTRYHINSKGVPGICKAKNGKCPFGGAESHYETPEQAQEAANEANESKFGILPKQKPTTFVNKLSAHGTRYTVDSNFNDSVENHPSVKRSGKITSENVSVVMNDTLTNGANASYYAEDFNNSEVKTGMEIYKIGENKFRAKGHMDSYIMIEDDFDSHDEYQEYLDGGYDASDTFDFEFSGEDVEKELDSGFYGSDNARGAENASGTILGAVYSMARENI